MNKHVKIVTLIDLLFLCILLLSSLSGSSILGRALYVAAFILPTIVGIIAIHKAKKSSHPVAFVAFLELDDENAVPPEIPTGLGISIKKEGALLALPLIAPTVLLVFLLAALSNYLGALVGLSAPAVDEPFATALIMHALLPAVLEEMLFRYLPIKLIGECGANMRYALFASALFFALSHANPIQIPYAFAAGIVLFVISVITSSILPAIVIHLANNVISLLSSYGYMSTAAYVIFAAVLVASAVAVILRRRAYVKKLAEYFSESSREFSYAPLAFIIPALLLTLLNTV